MFGIGLTVTEFLLLYLSIMATIGLAAKIFQLIWLPNK